MPLLNLLSGLLRRVDSSAAVDPDTVQQVSAGVYVKWPVRCREQCLRVYGPAPGLPAQQPPLFHLVLLREMRASSGGSCDDNRAFLLSRRSGDAAELTAMHERLSETLVPLAQGWPADVLHVHVLQQVCKLTRDNRHWGLAHVAAALGRPDFFRSPLVLQAMQYQLPYVSSPCVSSPDAVDVCYTTPLHVAVSGEHMALLRLLLQLSCVSVTAEDWQGDTALHAAARVDASGRLVRLLTQHVEPPALNSRNHCNLTPLHMACLFERPESVRALVMAGADVNASIKNVVCSADNTDGPVSAESALRLHPRELNHDEMKLGGSALHWAASGVMTRALLELGCHVDALNFAGETPLHVMARCGRLDAAVLLLAHAASVDLTDGDGNTPLLLAAAAGHVALTRILLAFGACRRHRNARGETALHHAAVAGERAVASGDDDARWQHVVFTLLAVGAPRCAPPLGDCVPACTASDSGAGGRRPSDAPPQVQQRVRQDLDDMLSVAVMDDEGGGRTDGCRLLCLDGGGIRGLVLVQILVELEQLCCAQFSSVAGCSEASGDGSRGLSLMDCFDYVAGTSVGGILALALARGRSPRQCQRLFFSMKDRVFVGARPYSSEALEQLLQTELGDAAVMTDIVRPRVMVTGVLADRHPADLHMFRNYPSAEQLLELATNNSEFEAPPSPWEQLLWKVGRCSGAAPTFFRPADRFIDGGLIANNPTLDALTEIFEQQVALRALGRMSSLQPPAVVLSLGCGRPPVVQVKEMDVSLPNSWIDLAKLGNSVQALINLLVDQATSSDNRVVDRARAWCGWLRVPYARCSPQLSLELPLDETSDERLALVLWETMVYLQQQRLLLAKFAKLLTATAGETRQ